MFLLFSKVIDTKFIVNEWFCFVGMPTLVSRAAGLT